MPPRNLKSVTANVAFSTWLLGHNPKERVVSVSYSAELAEKFARDSKKVMESDWYRGAFPRTVISRSRSAVNDFNTTAHGGRFTASVEGGLTGRGGNIIIIDDPIKASDASSEHALNKVNDLFNTTVLNRLDNPNTGAIILVMQRVHENDLTGYLLDLSDEWTHVKMPAIATEDEIWDIGSNTFCRKKGRPLNQGHADISILQNIQAVVGTYIWSAQYQQNPCPLEGGIIKGEWLHYSPSGGFDINNVARVFISWDTANKPGPENAYSAGVVVVMTRDRKFHLVDVYRGKWDMPALLANVKELYNGWKYNTSAGNTITMLIEDAASGSSLIQILNNELDAHARPFNIIAIKPDSDKVSRLFGISAYIENGTLMFPAEDEAWWPDFKKELLGFPGVKYKDQVDAMSQCINYAMQHS